MPFLIRLAVVGAVTGAVVWWLNRRGEQAAPPQSRAPPPQPKPRKPIPPSPPPPPKVDPLDEVRRMARAGDKIEAIKRYREITGSDLATAREAVEAMV